MEEDENIFNINLESLENEDLDKIFLELDDLCKKQSEESDTWWSPEDITLDKFKSKKFEEPISEMLSQIGYDTYETKHVDKGLDLLIVKDGYYHLVQIKNKKTSVGSTPIERLNQETPDVERFSKIIKEETGKQALEENDKGYIIIFSTSGFTKRAFEYQDEIKTPVNLITGPEIAFLLTKHGVNKKEYL